MKQNTEIKLQGIQLEKQSKKKGKMVNGSIIALVFIIGLIASIFLQRTICQNWQLLSLKIFGFSKLTGSFQKLTVLKQAMLYMAIFEFFIVVAIMSIRILGQKTSPVNEKDPLSISLLNRILSNNLEQSFVFFGLYAYLLLQGPLEIEIKYVFSLPLIFILGRVLFGISYIVATIVRVSTVRSFGFFFSVGVNLLMIEQILDCSTIWRQIMFS